MKAPSLSRRQFLKGTGALVVSFNLFPSLSPVFGQTTVGPGIEADPTLLDSWLAIAQDGAVTVFSGKVDLGTGAGAVDFYGIFRFDAAKKKLSPVKLKDRSGKTDGAVIPAGASETNALAFSFDDIDGDGKIELIEVP